MRRARGAGPGSRARLCVALFVVGALAACGGGSSPVAPNPPPPPAPPAVSFVSESEDVRTESIRLTMPSTGPDAFTLALVASSVTDLFGYGLDIVYDPAIIAFDGAEVGTFFDGEDVEVATQVVEVSTGTLVIGQSRVGDVPGVSGSGNMLMLNFKTVAAGVSTLSIQNAGAFDSTGPVPTLEFVGGTVTVPSTAR